MVKKNKKSTKKPIINIGIFLAIVGLINLLRIPYLLWKDSPYLYAETVKNIGTDVLLPSLIIGLLALLFILRGLRLHAKSQLNILEENTLQNFNIICLVLAIIAVTIMIFTGVVMGSTSKPGFLGWDAFSTTFGAVFKIALTSGVLIFIVYILGRLYRVHAISKQSN